MIPSTPQGLADVRYADLQGQRVFVTGGGSGIGAAIVTAFAQQGARVAFVDVDDAASVILTEQVVQADLPPPWWRHNDVRDVPALQSALADAAAELGDFHVLVNNVASDERHTLDSVTPAYYDDRIALNQRAAFFALQAVLPGMRRLGAGAVVNVGSFGWQIKNADYPCYAVAKSAINGLTRGTAAELGRDRIRINTVTPGWVMTPRQVSLWLTPEGEREIDRNQCLPGRVQAEDVAAMVLFLASEQARMCTAQEFTVDGGWR